MPRITSGESFELVERCYCPGCIRDADMDSSGGPVCRVCYCKMQISDCFWEAYTYRSAGWATKDFVKNRLEEIQKYEQEIVSLELGYRSRYDEFKDNFSHMVSMERDT